MVVHGGSGGGGRGRGAEVREGGRESSLNRQARPVCRAVSLLSHPPSPLPCTVSIG